MNQHLCCNCKKSESKTLCKVCASYFCEDCVELKVLVKSAPEEGEVCLVCFSLVKSLEELLEEEKINWGTNSVRGQSWMRDSGAWNFMKAHPGVYRSYDVAKLNQEDRDAIEKDVLHGRTDPGVFNWEIKETLLRLEVASYREDISEVLQKYCIRNPNIGYCQGLNYVAVWLLMFFDKEHAFWMLCYLIERWLLPDFYSGNKRGNSLNGFYIESTVISALLKYTQPDIELACMPSDEFSDFFSLQLLIQMFVNTIDFASTIFLWDKLSEEGSIALIKGVVSCVSISMAAIINQEHPIQVLKILAQSRISVQLEVTYAEVSEQITPKRVTRLRNHARDYRAKQWQECESFIVKRLENCSNFSRQEIEALQKEFKKLLLKKRQTKGPSKPRKRRTTVFLHPKIQEQIANTDGEIDIGISKAEFLEMMNALNQNMSYAAGALFDQFDEDKSGYLDFRELMICMSLISKGSFQDKLRICFDAYDIDHSGYLKTNQMLSLIENLLKPYCLQLVEKFTQDLKNLIDKVYTKMMTLAEKNGNLVSFSDLYKGITSDPVLYSCFSEHVKAKKTQTQNLAKLLSEASRNTDNQTGQVACSKCQVF